MSWKELAINTSSRLLTANRPLTSEELKMANRNIKNEITTKIIELIDEHGSDWVKPFSSLCGAPVNALTGKSYRGMNSFWLGLQGQTYWATYRQWAELGA
jgi:antirestriction protein ArdC